VPGGADGGAPAAMPLHPHRPECDGAYKRLSGFHKPSIQAPARSASGLLSAVDELGELKDAFSSTPGSDDQPSVTLKDDGEVA
jgi:hypothetical protein